MAKANMVEPKEEETIKISLPINPRAKEEVAAEAEPNVKSTRLFVMVHKFSMTNGIILIDQLNSRKQRSVSHVIQTAIAFVLATRIIQRIRGTKKEPTLPK